MKAPQHRDASRTPRRTSRDLLPVLGNHKALLPLLRQVLVRPLVFASLDALLRLPVLVQTYARSSHEDGDEWSRTPRRALRCLPTALGLLLRGQPRNIIFQTYARLIQVMKPLTMSALDRTPRRALLLLLPRIERVTAPADLARARILHELLQRLSARRDPRDVDRFHFSACDRLEVIGVAGRVDDRCRV